MVLCKLDSPQGKRNLIFNITDFVCELSHKLRNDLRLKKIRKWKENLKIGWEQNLVSNFFSKHWFLAISVKRCLKADMKLSWFYPVLLIFLLFAKYFVTNCRRYNYSFIYFIIRTIPFLNGSFWDDNIFKTISSNRYSQIQYYLQGFYSRNF